MSDQAADRRRGALKPSLPLTAATPAESWGREQLIRLGACHS